MRTMEYKCKKKAQKNWPIGKFSPSFLLLFFLLGSVFFKTPLAKKMGAKNFPSDSIFHLESLWRTEEGKTLRLSDLAGKPHFIALIFTTCQGVCPLLVNDLKAISQKFNKKNRKKARFLLVSIDPETDMPEVLMSYKKKMKLDERWTLLNGKIEDVNEVSAVLEFQFKENVQEKYTHSSALYFMNAKGQIVVSQMEREQNSSIFFEKVQSVLEEHKGEGFIRSIWKKIKSFGKS